jgi:hypothetical protein
MRRRGPAAGLLANRAAVAMRRRVRMLRHRGFAVWCPVCGHAFDRFMDDWNRPNALCWRCGAHERHRAIALLLDRRPELLGRAHALLHFAPEWCLQQRLKRGVQRYRYLTADLDQPGVDLRLDITTMGPTVAAGEWTNGLADGLAVAS